MGTDRGLRCRGGLPGRGGGESGLSARGSRFRQGYGKDGIKHDRLRVGKV